MGPVTSLAQATLAGWLVTMGWAAASPAAAQILQGRVLDGETGQAVPQTVIRLLDASGEAVDLSISSLDGGYSLSAPSPGTYVVEGERIGYAPYRSGEVVLGRAGATYEVDLLVRAQPIKLPGLEVTTERMEQIERGLQLELGVAVASIRYRPILRPTIDEHLIKGHDITALLRWSNLPSIVVIDDPTRGPCFQFRLYNCLPVFLNGAPVRRELVPVLPLDAIETVVVLQPNETMQYGGGAILLFTAGWVRTGR